MPLNQAQIRRFIKNKARFWRSWQFLCTYLDQTEHLQEQRSMSDKNEAITVVSNFLEASMAPDPERAAAFMAADVRITFTGGRKMKSPQAITEFNRGRYTWVKKSLGQFDWTEHADHTVVYSNGTLYGEWPDGTPFEGNRYLDRFEVRNGKITRMDVWNDSAEWLLAPELNHKR
jgi:ketosteroid isomerase-like protein